MQKILTPTDLGQTITGVYQIEILFSPAVEFDAEFRRLKSAIFDDLEYIGPSEPELISSYLDSIADPLSELQKWNIQIVVIYQKCYYHSENDLMPLTKTIYFIAPDPCYFQKIGVKPSCVHKLGANCDTGTHELKTKTGDALKCLFSRYSLELEFENNIPWCPRCVIYDLESKIEPDWYNKLNKVVSDITKIVYTNDPELIRKEIEQGENETHEFKQTLRMNIKTNKNDPQITHAVLKTINAFLNTSGGILFIGVDDNKNIVGLSKDGFENDDNFLSHLTDIIKSSMGNIACTKIQSRIVNINGLKICRIFCQPSSTPVFLNHLSKESFYIRTGPQSRELSPQDLIQYIKEHFPDS